MYSLPRRAACPKNLKNLAKNCRSICSDKSEAIQTSSSFSDAKDGSRIGYGEKEICLFGPVDARMPLPGNTGVALVNNVYQDIFTFKPRTPKKKSNQLFPQTPEDRQDETLTQFICAVIENTLMSSASTFECLAYDCPELLKKDFSDLFPQRDLSNETFTVLTICQKTKEDMSQWSNDTDAERVFLGETFVLIARAMCSALQEFGYWTDFIHPNSGKPHASTSITNATMFETDIRYSHFGFKIEDLGCCKVISHYLWGTHTFVGAIFTNASKLELKQVMQKHPRKI